ncbi:MAG: tyrosine-type recombinase/integrase [Flavobacteriaceae bacterium]|nr:tyrosine-type recombinase/integrase [Flavobacteriaceae bacterium]
MQLIQSFLEYLSLEKKYSKHTIVAYKTDLKLFVNFLEEEFEDTNLTKVNYSQIRSWIVFLVAKKITNKTINRKISSLKTFYKFLMRLKEIKETPLQKHKALKTPKRVNVPFNNKEIEKALNIIGENNDFISIRNKMIIELLYATGIRRNELITLQIKDIDLEQQVIKVLGKRDKERYIPLLKSIQKTMKEYLKIRKEYSQQNDYLFITKKEKKMYGTLVYRIIKHYFSAVSSKVKKSPHILRHAFATHLLNEGADLNAVKELLGHASLASTQVYTNSSLSKIKQTYNQAHPRSKK